MNNRVKERHTLNLQLAKISKYIISIWLIEPESRGLTKLHTVLPDREINYKSISN